MPVQRQHQKADRWSVPRCVIPQAHVRRAPSNHQSVFGQEAGEERARSDANDRAKKLKESLHADHGVVAQTWTVQRGLTRARQSLAKDAEEYGKLRPLFSKLTSKYETTVTDILLHCCLLKRSFLCLGYARRRSAIH